MTSKPAHAPTTSLKCADRALDLDAFGGVTYPATRANKKPSHAQSLDQWSSAGRKLTESSIELSRDRLLMVPESLVLPLRFKWRTGDKIAVMSRHTCAQAI